MTLRELRPVGLDYLRLVSTLLQDARRAEPFGGIWEAADLQWSWRIDQHPDPALQSIWFDGGGQAVVAAVFSRWKGILGCDLLGSDAAVAAESERLWDHVRARLGADTVAMAIRDDDPVRRLAAERAGFAADGETYSTGWMSATDRPRLPHLGDGLRIESYHGGVHPMVGRNGDAVARRLAECPLYRPDLDLAMRDGDALVGYALFWADPVTGVGLLEPMRIEAPYQGRGLSKALIAAGLDRLAAAGCTRLKVGWDQANEAAARLYTGAGYRIRSTERTWTRPGSG